MRQVHTAGLLCRKNHQGLQPRHPPRQSVQGAHLCQKGHPVVGQVRHLPVTEGRQGLPGHEALQSRANSGRSSGLKSHVDITILKRNKQKRIPAVKVVANRVQPLLLLMFSMADDQHLPPGPTAHQKV